jgi:hypothetical protein
VVELQLTIHARRKNRNYNQVLTFCMKDPRSKTDNAIGSSSMSTAPPHLIAAKNIVARDATTWDGAPRAYCDGAKGPPWSHDSREVEENLHSPVEETVIGDKGWRSRPSTIKGSSQEGAVADDLPREASELP